MMHSQLSLKLFTEVVNSLMYQMCSKNKVKFTTVKNHGKTVNISSLKLNRALYITVGQGEDRSSPTATDVICLVVMMVCLDGLPSRCRIYLLPTSKSPTRDIQIFASLNLQ